MSIIRLFNEDCMIWMKKYPDKYFELSICDPPYGIKRDGGFGGFGGFGKPIARKKYKGKWDDQTPKLEYFKELQRISVNQIIFGGQFFTDKLPVSGHWIFWDNLNTMPTFGDGELAWTSFKRNSVKRYVCEYNGLLGKEENRIHATQKPVKLYKWLLTNYAKSGDKILDTHFGSLSIGIACHDLGFDLDAYEIDKDYFEAGKKRLETHQKQIRIDFDKTENIERSLISSKY